LNGVDTGFADFGNYGAYNPVSLHANLKLKVGDAVTLELTSGAL